MNHERHLFEVEWWKRRCGGCAVCILSTQSPTPVRLWTDGGRCILPGESRIDQPAQRRLVLVGRKVGEVTVEMISWLVMACCSSSLTSAKLIRPGR